MNSVATDPSNEMPYLGCGLRNAILVDCPMRGGKPDIKNPDNLDRALAEVVLCSPGLLRPEGFRFLLKLANLDTKRVAEHLRVTVQDVQAAKKKTRTLPTRSELRFRVFVAETLGFERLHVSRLTKYMEEPRPRGFKIRVKVIGFKKYKPVLPVLPGPFVSGKLTESLAA